MRRKGFVMQRKVSNGFGMQCVAMERRFGARHRPATRWHCRDLLRFAKATLRMEQSGLAKQRRGWKMNGEAKAKNRLASRRHGMLCLRRKG